MHVSLYLPQRLIRILFITSKPADGFPLNLSRGIRTDPQNRNRKGKNVYGNLLIRIIGAADASRL